MKGFLEGHDNQASIGTANAPIAIASTVSRASYGIQFETPFLSLIHLEKDRFWDKHEGEHMARHQMKWYLKRVCINHSYGLSSSCQQAWPYILFKTNMTGF